MYKCIIMQPSEVHFRFVPAAYKKGTADAMPFLLIYHLLPADENSNCIFYFITFFQKCQHFLLI